MLQACYPAEISNSSFSCLDRRMLTTDVGLDPAQQQAQAIGSLYARLQGNDFGPLNSNTAGVSFPTCGCSPHTWWTLWKPTTLRFDLRELLSWP